MQQEPLAATAADDDPTSELDTGTAVPPGNAASGSMQLSAGRFADAPACRGTLLRGRYLLEECVGMGGTAEVWQARDTSRDGAGVAVKLLRPDLRRETATIDGLKREFQLAQSLAHPNIAQVFDLDCEGDVWFLAMELLDGESLAALLKRQGAKPLPALRAREILQACGDALVFAHQRGIVHGDIKPANVVITQTGRVCLLDFGAATSSSLPAAARARTVTRAYASPEVLSGAPAERRDDVFSFACVAYELLTGRHPFSRTSALDARKANREPARAWHLTDRQWYPLQASLAWQRESRPADLRALLAELPTADTPAPLDIPPVTLSPLEFSPPNTAPLRASLAIGGFGLALTIAFFQLQGSPDDFIRGDSNLQARELTQATLAPLAALDATVPASAPASAPAPASTSASVLPSASTPATAPIPTAMRSSISFGEPTVTVYEQAAVAALVLERSDALSGSVSIKWRATSGSATEGQDFARSTGGTAAFSAGQTSHVIYIPLLNDNVSEPDEIFLVELHEPSRNARIGPRARAVITIRDDDGP